MDELQNIWNASSDRTTTQHLDQAQLNKQLIDKTHGAIHQINKVMKIDALIMVILTIVFIAVTFVINLQSKYTVSLLLFGMMVFLGVHYWIKYIFINKNDFENESIVGILSKKITYLAWNKQVYVYGVPVFSFVFYLYLQTLLMQLKFEAFIISEMVLIRYGLGIPFAIGIYFFTKWLHGRLFGKELKTLQRIVDELNY